MTSDGANARNKVSGTAQHSIDTRSHDESRHDAVAAVRRTL